VFRKALNSVPKSGEVWCEGARIALHQGLLDEARKYLAFAIQFTPQYGDSFVEQLRLELLCSMKANNTGNITQVLAMPSTKATLRKLELTCLNAEPTYGVCWTYCKDHPSDSPSQALRNAKTKYTTLLNTMKLNVTEECYRWDKISAHMDIAAAYFKSDMEMSSPDFKFKGIFN